MSMLIVQAYAIYTTYIQPAWVQPTLPTAQINTDNGRCTAVEMERLLKSIKERIKMTYANVVKLFPSNERIPSPVYAMSCVRGLVVMDDSKFVKQSMRMTILYEYSLRHCLIQWRIQMRTSGMLYIMFIIKFKIGFFNSRTLLDLHQFR